MRERMSKGMGVFRINCEEGKNRCLNGHENEGKYETCRGVEFGGRGS